MPLSRAEIQKRYRQRKKSNEGEKYLASERVRQKQYYKPVELLSRDEKVKRNKSINERVRKHRKNKKSAVQQAQRSESDAISESESGYNTGQSERLVVKLPMGRPGPSKRRTSSLRAVKRQLDKVRNEKYETEKKLKTLQRRMQRLHTSKSNTPNSKTKLFLQKSGLRRRIDKNVQRELLFGNVLMHQVKMNTKRVKTNPKKKQHIIGTISGDIVRKYRCIARLSKEFNVDRRKVANIISKGVNFSKLRRQRLAEKYKETVIQFFERDDNSRIQPGKRDAVKIETGKKQARVLTDYMSNLHLKYRAENPEHTLSLSTFQRMRPGNILLTRAIGRNVCLCTKHQNIALKLQSLRKNGIDLPQNPETLLEAQQALQKISYHKQFHSLLGNA